MEFLPTASSPLEEAVWAAEQDAKQASSLPTSTLESRSSIAGEQRKQKHHADPVALPTLEQAIAAYVQEMRVTRRAAKTLQWHQTSLGVLRRSLWKQFHLTDVGSLTRAHLQIWIYTAINTAPVNFSLAAAFSLLLFLAITLALLVQATILRARSFQIISGRNCPTRIITLGAWKWPATALCGLFFLLALVIPLGMCLLLSLLHTFGQGLTAGNWTLANYEAVLAQGSDDLAALQRTVLLAVTTASVVTLVGLPIAFILRRTTLPGRRLLHMFTLVTIAVPGIILACGYIFAWNAPYLQYIGIGNDAVPFYGTIWILLAAYIGGSLPYATRLSIGGLDQVGLSLLEQDLLEMVNLPAFGDRYSYQLSGGQQQRVALARALATQPSLLLLDEPLSSLDTALRENMRAELVQIFRRLKITAINVTHDQAEAMSMSDRILVLRDGLLQQIGTPTELYLTPVNTFVASFMGPANLLAGESVGHDAQIARVTLRIEGNGLNGRLISGQASNTAFQRLNGRAHLLCRPDDIIVHSEACAFGHTNVLQGTVFYSSFVGGRWHTLVQLPEEQQASPVLAYTSFHPHEQQRVWLELPPERCRIIAE